MKKYRTITAKKLLAALGEQFANTVHSAPTQEKRFGAYQAYSDTYALVMNGSISHSEHLILEHAFQARLRHLEAIKECTLTTLKELEEAKS